MAFKQNRPRGDCDRFEPYFHEFVPPPAVCLKGLSVRVLMPFLNTRRSPHSSHSLSVHGETCEELRTSDAWLHYNTITCTHSLKPCLGLFWVTVNTNTRVMLAALKTSKYWWFNERDEWCRGGQPADQVTARLSLFVSRHRSLVQWEEAENDPLNHGKSCRVWTHNMSKYAVSCWSPSSDASGPSCIVGLGMWHHRPGSDWKLSVSCLTGKMKPVS